MLSTKINAATIALIAAFSFAAASVPAAHGLPPGKLKELEEPKEAKCKYIQSGPVALLSAMSPASPSTGDIVTFDGSKSSGYSLRCVGLIECITSCELDPVSVNAYHWRFGDGSTEETETPRVTHAYKTAGTYTVSLTVTAGGHTSRNTATEKAPVADRPPTAAFTAPRSATTATLSRFDASASADPDGTIVNYHWAFGDGVTQDTTQPTVGHRYTRAASFEVVLTVTDNSANTATTQRRIRVSSPPRSGSSGGNTGGGSTGGATGTARASISSKGTVLTSRRHGAILVDTRLVVSCAAGSVPCRVTLEAYSQSSGRAASVGHAKKTRRKIAIGRAKVTVAAGSAAQLSFKLNATGAALLHRLKHLGATLFVTVHDGTPESLTTTRKIVIKTPR
jgi:PKD repeat protein